MSNDPNLAKKYGIAVDAIRNILAASKRINQRLDDPHRDGLGTDAVSPTGDDFNELDAQVTGFALEALAILNEPEEV